MTTKSDTSKPPSAMEEAIQKCLVVIFLKKVDAGEVATKRFMDKFFAVSPESIKEVKSCPTSDQNMLAVFVEADQTISAKFMFSNWKKNPRVDVEVHMAAEFLCHAASKKHSNTRFQNPSSAFYALYKTDPLYQLASQKPQSVNIHVNASNVSTMNQSPYFQPPRSQFGSMQHFSHNDVFTSGVAASTSGYPFSAPVQPYSAPPNFPNSLPMSLGQSFDSLDPSTLAGTLSAFQSFQQQPAAMNSMQYNIPQLFPNYNPFTNTSQFNNNGTFGGFPPRPPFF